MRHTPNYHLPQWDPEDRIRREDFNGAFSILDAAIVVGAGQYGYLVTLLDDVGSPVSGVTISGISTNAGAPCVTDGNGQVLGVSTAKSVTISATSPFINLQNVSRTVASTDIITQVTLRFSRTSSNKLTFTSGKTFRLSPSVNNYDVVAIGGGGSGGGATGGGGGGGGGGYGASVSRRAATKGAVYTVLVGAGGASQTMNAGATGGTSKFSAGGTEIVSALGGSGGGLGSRNVGGAPGNGNGAGGKGYIWMSSAIDIAAENGAPATNRISGYTFGGGGSGGGGAFNEVGVTSTFGGSPYGGDYSVNPVVAGAGKGYGGGGAGGCTRSNTVPSGAGGPGVVFFEWRYA